jgi:hypothetical protein
MLTRLAVVTLGFVTEFSADRNVSALKSGTIVGFVGLVLAAQILVPITALNENRPSRFGWQMFADMKSQPIVTVKTPVDSHSYPLQSVYARWRPEANYVGAVVKQACEQTATAVSVVLTEGEADVNGEYACSGR